MCCDGARHAKHTSPAAVPQQSLQIRSLHGSPMLPFPSGFVTSITRAARHSAIPVPIAAVLPSSRDSASGSSRCSRADSVPHPRHLLPAGLAEVCALSAGSSWWHASWRISVSHSCTKPCTWDSAVQTCKWVHDPKHAHRDADVGQNPDACEVLAR